MSETEKKRSAYKVIAEAEARIREITGIPVRVWFEFSHRIELSAGLVISIVSSTLGMSSDDITGRSRIQAFVFARFHCYRLMRTYLGMSMAQIGRELNRDHSTVVKGLEVFKHEAKRNTAFRADFERCEKELIKRIS